MYVKILKYLLKMYFKSIFNMTYNIDAMSRLIAWPAIYIVLTQFIGRFLYANNHVGRKYTVISVVVVVVVSIKITFHSIGSRITLLFVEKNVIFSEKI